MAMITVRTIGEEVYFLTDIGFSLGVIKSRNLLENNTIEYRILTKNHPMEYQGDKVDSNEVFSTKEELFEYYKNKINNEL